MSLPTYPLFLERITNSLSANQQEAAYHFLNEDETIQSLTQGALPFQIHRNPKHHLAFGAGVHFCLGSWLARQQWKLAMKELFNRFPLLKQTDGHKWNPMLSIRDLSSLPVTG